MFRGWRHTHSDRIQRWLGHEQAEQLSRSMRDWYGPPILVANVPSLGGVWATRGGDFIGQTFAGRMCSMADYYIERTRKWSRQASRTAGTGFADYADFLLEAKSKRQFFAFQKVETNPANAVGGTNTSFYLPGLPAAGSAAAAAPGGTVPTNATTGAIPFRNVQVAGDTTHYAGGELTSTLISHTMLIYDRIFAVAKTMSSTATEAVTGVPTRYQSTTGGAADSAEGNFLNVQVSVNLGVTAHNWTVCLYEDQSGNTGITLPSLTGNPGSAAGSLDHPVASWFAPLASGDTGISDLEQMQCSASVTGTLDFVIGHPIAWLATPFVNLPVVDDAVWSALNFGRIFDDACLALLSVNKPVTTAATYRGSFNVVSG